MQMSLAARNPLVEEVYSDVLDAIEFSCPEVSSWVRLGETHSEKSLFLRGYEELLMLFDKQGNELTPVGVVSHQFALKFEVLVQVTGFAAASWQGFRLQDDCGGELVVLPPDEAATAQWVDYLRRHLLEMGFHRHFRSVGVVGRGASGTVYEVVGLHSGQHYAAKAVPKAGILGDGRRMHGFMNELYVLRSIRDRAVLELVSVYETDSNFFIVTELLQGGTLLEYLLTARSRAGPAEIRRIMGGVLRGLEVLEQEGVVHRDIKLENVMLREKRELEAVIVDFGLAVQSEEEDYGYYQAGTPGYMSPEVLALREGDLLTPLSDVFSAGAILHVLLVGRYLFEGKTPQEVFRANREMAIDLSQPHYQQADPTGLDLLGRMLSQEESDRPTAEECLRHRFFAAAETERAGVTGELVGGEEEVAK